MGQNISRNVERWDASVGMEQVIMFWVTEEQVTKHFELLNTREKGAGDREEGIRDKSWKKRQKRWWKQREMNNESYYEEKWDESFERKGNES